MQLNYTRHKGLVYVYTIVNLVHLNHNSGVEHRSAGIRSPSG